MNKDILLQALNVANKAVASKPLYPIMGCVLLTSKDGRMVINSSNFDLSIQVEIESDTELEIAVPAKKLGEIIGNLADKEVFLKQKDNTLNVKSGKYKANINGVVNDFPGVDFSGAMKYVDVIGFREQTQSVTYAASTNVNLPINGILFELEGDSITMVSTDGIRLAIAKESYPDVGTGSVLIPNANLREIHKIINQVKADTIGFSIAENSIRFDIRGDLDVKVNSLLISANFPNYHNIIPESYSTKAVVRTSQLVSACKQANVISRENNGFVKLTVGNGIWLYTSADIGQTETFVEATCEGNIEIGLNIDYLMDALASSIMAEISLEFSASNRPIVLRDKYIHIIMPMQL